MITKRSDVSRARVLTVTLYKMEENMWREQSRGNRRTEEEGESRSKLTGEMSSLLSLQCDSSSVKY